MQGPETRASLIQQLGDPKAEEAWEDFTRLYRPLVIRIARAKGLQHADAEDLAQDVFSNVGRAIHAFDPEADGSFRGWLFAITRNLCVNQLNRRRGPIGTGDSAMHQMLNHAPADEETVSLFELEHRRLVFRLSAEKLRPQFSESTWMSFWLTAVDGLSIEEAAKQLGKSPGALRVARCRVLARLKASIDDASYSGL